MCIRDRLEEVQRFREAHPLTPEAQERVPVPKYLYYGREVWESAAAALLCGCLRTRPEIRS